MTSSAGFGFFTPPQAKSEIRGKMIDVGQVGTRTLRAPVFKVRVLGSDPSTEMGVGGEETRMNERLITMT